MTTYFTDTAEQTLRVIIREETPDAILVSDWQYPSEYEIWVPKKIASIYNERQSAVNGVWFRTADVDLPNNFIEAEIDSL